MSTPTTTPEDLLRVLKPELGEEGAHDFTPRDLELLISERFEEAQDFRPAGLPLALTNSLETHYNGQAPPPLPNGWLSPKDMLSSALELGPPQTVQPSAHHVSYPHQPQRVLSWTTLQAEPSETPQDAILHHQSNANAIYGGAATEQLISVKIVDVDGSSITVPFKSLPPITCEGLGEQIRGGGVGAGCLLDKDDIALRLEDVVPAGNYTYRVNRQAPPPLPNGWVSPKDLLSSALELGPPQTVQPSAHHVSYPHQPQRVLSWTTLQAEPSETLQDAILHHQSHANAIYGGEALPSLLPDYPSAFNRERHIRERLNGNVCDRLMRLLHRIPEVHRPTPQWTPEACTILIQGVGALPNPVTVQSPAPTAAHAAAAQPAATAGVQPAATAAVNDPSAGQSGQHSSEGSHRDREDLALKVPTSTSKRVICIGEVKGCMFTLEPWRAWDLVQLFNDNCNVVRGIVSQIYTYLVAWKVQYGFISCWYSTWLVFCPANDRHTLFVSPPYLSTTTSTAESPAVTTMGALAWLQHQAIKTMDEQVEEPEELDEPAALGRESSHDDGTWTNPKDEDFSPSDERKQKKKRAAPSEPLGTTQHCMVIQEILEGGDHGTVARGLYDGVPAVLKFYGPEARSAQAFHRELDAYSRLRDLQEQGTVPEVLGHGYLPRGILVLALRQVDGVPYSSLRYQRNTEQAVQAAEAAQQALASLHGRGVLHGDMHGGNLMLVQRQGQDPGVACVILDFGRAKIDPTEEERRLEVECLQKVIG